MRGNYAEIHYKKTAGSDSDTLCSYHSLFLMRLAPGSPFTAEWAYPPEVMANIEAKYHLNEPLYKQYFIYLDNLAHGDLVRPSNTKTKA